MTKESSDDPETVHSYLCRFLSEHRAAEHLSSGRVRVDGVIITDPSHVLRPDSKLVLISN